MSTKDLSQDTFFRNVVSEGDPEALFDDLRQVGHGNFGAVFYANRTSDSHCVAIKKIKCLTDKNAEQRNSDIILELKVLTQVVHPNIVEFYNVFYHKRSVWLVMEYCIGSLYDLLNVSSCNFTEPQISYCVNRMMDALGYFHGLGFIHRDIKASNILVTAECTVKLADFGTSSIKPTTNTFVGSPYWIAPEVILAMEDGIYNQKSDIWSTCITAIELAQGKPPLYDMNAMSALYNIGQNDPPKLNNHENFSADFNAFLEFGLVRDPLRRPTAEEAMGHVFLRNFSAFSAKQMIGELVDKTLNKATEIDKKLYDKFKNLEIIASNNVGSGSRDSVKTDVSTDFSSGSHSIAVSGEPTYKNADAGDLKERMVSTESLLYKFDESENSLVVVDRSALPDKIDRKSSVLKAASDLKKMGTFRANTVKLASMIAEESNYYSEDFFRKKMIDYQELRKTLNKNRKAMQVKLEYSFNEFLKDCEKKLDTEKLNVEKNLVKMQLKQKSDYEQLLKMQIAQEKKLLKKLTQDDLFDRRVVPVHAEASLNPNLKNSRESNPSPRQHTVSANYSLSGTVSGSNANQSANLNANADAGTVNSNSSFRTFKKKTEIPDEMVLEMPDLFNLRQNQAVERYMLKQQMYMTFSREKLDNLRMFNQLKVSLLQQEMQIKLDNTCLIDRLKRENLLQIHSAELASLSAYNKKMEIQLNKEYLAETKKLPKEMKALIVKYKKEYVEGVKLANEKYNRKLSAVSGGGVSNQLSSSLQKNEISKRKANLKLKRNNKIEQLRQTYRHNIATDESTLQFRMKELITKREKEVNERLAKDRNMLEGFQKAQLENTRNSELMNFEELKKSYSEQLEMMRQNNACMENETEEEIKRVYEESNRTREALTKGGEESRRALAKEEGAEKAQLLERVELPPSANSVLAKLQVRAASVENFCIFDDLIEKREGKTA